jgi:general stress protein YciG
MNDNQNTKKKSGKQGFASMDPEEQRAIASKGGQAAHQSGKAHEWNSEEAKEAGRLGGQNSRGSNNQDVDTDEE